jgi:NAD kinase
MVDGQVRSALQAGDRIPIERYESNFLLVRNPAYPKWHGLVTKLRWGQAPSYQ